MKSSPKKGIGLVFAGGGGKGSYEIGVWKYLHEIGLDQYVCTVSGTSVGALNAAMFVGGGYEATERLWLNISQDKILKPKKNEIQEQITKAVGASAFEEVNEILKSLEKTAIKGIGALLIWKISGDGWFSREGLQEMISEGMSYNILRNSDISCYVTCCAALPGLKIERFRLNDYSDEEIETLLLASSAIPVVFPSEKFRGKKYYDGGLPVVGDNVPIQPVYDAGVRYIVVVHLDQTTVIDKSKFPGATIIEMIPKKDLGSLTEGTMDFSRKGAERRLNLGYEDARRVLQPFIEAVLLKAKNEKWLRHTQEQMEAFERQKKELQQKIRDDLEEVSLDVIHDVKYKKTY